MKFNKFLLKCLVREFPFLPRFFAGQKEVREFHHCGAIWSRQREEVSLHCPRCKELLPTHKGVVIYPEISKHDPENILIKTVDGDFLRRIPSHYQWDCLVSKNICGGESIYIVTDRAHHLSQGALYGIHGPVSRESRAWWADHPYWDTIYAEGESVADAIDSLGINPSQIIAVLELRYATRRTDGSLQEDLIIWKASECSLRKAQGF